VTSRVIPAGWPAAAPVQAGRPDVDYRAVTPAATFAELLDLELGRAVEEPPAAPAWTGAAAALPTLRPFVPFEIPFIARPKRYGTVPLRADVTGMSSTSGEARARLALEGDARTATDFTVPDLRAAFRQLSREYHPDRHPSASQAEAAQWSSSFSDLVGRYHQLTAALTSRQ
jgi:hypothetical protein